MAVDLKDLVSTTNTIIKLTKPTPEALRLAFSEADRVLSALLESQEFAELIRRVEDNPKYEPVQLRAIREDVKEFSRFVEVERHALKEAGLDDAALEVLLNITRDVHLRAARHESIDDIRKGIAQVRDQARSVAVELKEQPESVMEKPAKARRILKRVVMVVGGATVIVTNGLAETTMGQFYAGVSMAFGVEMVTSGFKPEG